MTNKRTLANAQKWVEQHADADLAVSVEAVDGETVDVCVGSDAERPRTLSVADGAVTDNAKGQHDCA